MCAAVHLVYVQDGRLPELAIGGEVDTDLAIQIDDTRPLTTIDLGTRSITRVTNVRSVAFDTVCDVQGQVIPFEGRPNLWLIDAGEVILPAYDLTTCRFPPAFPLSSGIQPRSPR